MRYNEIIEGLKKAPYDFIANNYWQMSRQQLKDVILELLAQFEGLEYEHIKKELITNLLDFKGWDDYIDDEKNEPNA